MHSLSFDIAHLLAGGMLVLSFLLLYQDRLTAVLNVFALAAGGLTHAAKRPVCLAEWIVRRVGRGASAWRRR